MPRAHIGTKADDVAVNQQDYFDSKKMSTASTTSEQAVGSDTPPPSYDCATTAESIAGDSRPPSYPSTPTALGASDKTTAAAVISALSLTPTLSLSEQPEDKIASPLYKQETQLQYTSKQLAAFAFIDGVYTVSLNALGVLFTLSQLGPAISLRYNILPDAMRQSTWHASYTQASWDLHDWLEEAELHPPSIWLSLTAHPR